jgi:hypothetical protein
VGEREREIEREMKEGKGEESKPVWTTDVVFLL